MKPEARLWSSMRTRMPMRGDRLDRIENSLGSGMPDVNGCLGGEDVFIELKAPIEPKRPTTPLMNANSNHKLMLSQINWFKRQYQAGGIAFILVRTDKRLMLLDGCAHADGFNAMTTPRMADAALLHERLPMSNEQWSFLRYVLITASRHRRLLGHASAQQLLNDLERERVDGDRVSPSARPDSRKRKRPEGSTG